MASPLRLCYIRSTCPPERNVVLTFDDGLANFAETAWPILREMSFSATAYVPTDFIGAEAAWYANTELPTLPCMAWDALRGTQREGADIQSHAGSHRDLTRLPPDEIREELHRSKAVLEDGLGDCVEHLAYPFGAVAPSVQEAAREAGCRSAVVLGEGRWQANTDPHKIPRDGLDRIAIRSSRTARLSIEACARGSFGWYAATKAVVPAALHLVGLPLLAGRWIQLTLAAVLLMVPTTLLGATLPLLVEHLELNDERTTRTNRSRIVAALYGCNTAGAVAGVAVSGFVTIERYGLSRTAWIGAFLAACAAMLASVSARGADPRFIRVAHPSGDRS